MHAQSNHSDSPDSTYRVASWVALLLSAICFIAVGAGWVLVVSSTAQADVGDAFAQAVVGFRTLAVTGLLCLVATPVVVTIALRARRSSDRNIQFRGRTSLVLQSLISISLVVFLLAWLFVGGM